MPDNDVVRLARLRDLEGSRTSGGWLAGGVRTRGSWVPNRRRGAVEVDAVAVVVGPISPLNTHWTATDSDTQTLQEVVQHGEEACR